MSSTKERVTRGHGNEESGETVRGITVHVKEALPSGFTEQKDQKHETDRAKSPFLLYIQKHKGYCKTKLSTSQ